MIADVLICLICPIGLIPCNLGLSPKLQSILFVFREIEIDGRSVFLLAKIYK